MKKLAKEKFGSVKRACDAIGLNTYDFYNVMRRNDQAEKDLLIQYLNDAVVPEFDSDVGNEEIEKVKSMIVKTQKDFCLKYNFDQPTLSRLLAGKVKMKSKKIVKLLDKLRN